MPATQYKIWQVGLSVGEGATQSFHVGVAGIAKGNAPHLPHVVANEMICSHLGRALLLPIPPGFIIEYKDAPHYVSLNFNLAGEDLPPINPALVVQEHPRLSVGIVLFDAWIVNPDRHTRNIAHDRTTNRVQIFDHSHAFFAGQDGREYMSQREHDLAIGNHCLARQLTSFDGIMDWYDRIRQVPEFYIRGVVEDAAEVGLPNDSVDYCIDFLLNRRERLPELFRQNRNRFPHIAPALWDDLDAQGGMT